MQVVIDIRRFPMRLKVGLVLTVSGAKRSFPESETESENVNPTSKGAKPTKARRPYPDLRTNPASRTSCCSTAVGLHPLIW